MKPAEKKFNRRRTLSLAATILMIIPAFPSGCSLNLQLRRNTIENHFDEIIRKIKRNNNYLYELKDIRVGNTGYFYVIDIDGRIIYHPKEALIGMPFGKNPFISSIISKREGCYLQVIESVGKLIVFKPIDKYQILCMTISIEELNQEDFKCDDFKK